MSSLRVRRVKINKTEQLDELAHECGELYTQALVFFWHRDGVGATNIWYKYRGDLGVPHVVGFMAPPTGLRFYPHRVARVQREAASL